MRYFVLFVNSYSLIIILLLGLILRLINLNQSLWWDEAINVVYAQGNKFWWFVTNYPLGDFHPPGYFAVLWIWGHLFSFSEISVRLPSVIFGALTIYLSYLIGKELFIKKIGILAALFLSIAPLHIYYSQEARMYSMAAFAAVFSFYSLIRLVSNKKYGLVFYIFSTTLVLYSDYLTYFVIPAQFLWVFIYYKKILKKYLLTLTIIILFWSPWLLVFPDQFLSGQLTSGLILGWKEVVGGVGVREVLLLPLKVITGKITADNNLLNVLLFVILASPFGLALTKLSRLKQSSESLLLWFWLILPPGLALLFSFWVPVFSYFRFVFILPAFYLLIAVAVSKFTPRFSKILVVLLVMSGLISSSIYLFNSKFHREDWKSATSFIEENSDSQTLILHKNNEVPAPFKYYQRSFVETIPAYEKIPVKVAIDLNSLEQNLINYNKLYIFDYLVEITDPNRLLESKLRELKFIKTREYDFRGVGLIRLYEK